MNIIRKIINTEQAPKALGPYSQAVQINHILYCSGQLGINPETMDFTSRDVAEQTKQAMTNLGHILEAAGSDFHYVVKATIYLADINDCKVVTDVYATFFSAPYPILTTIEVANLPKLGNVKIEMEAIVGDIEDQ